MLTNLSSLFFRAGADDIRRVITLAISKFAVLAAVQFLLYSAEGLHRIIMLDRYASTMLGAGYYFGYRSLRSMF